MGAPVRARVLALGRCRPLALGADRATALTFFGVGFALVVLTFVAVTLAVVQGLLS